MKPMSIQERLGIDKFLVDDNEAHIVIDLAACAQCARQECACVKACPAGLYELEADSIKFDYAGCLECGTCRVVCRKGAIQWTYPNGGFGVEYRYG